MRIFIQVIDSRTVLQRAWGKQDWAGGDSYPRMRSQLDISFNQTSHKNSGGWIAAHIWSHFEAIGMIFRVWISTILWLKFSKGVEDWNSLPNEEAPEGNSLEKREATPVKIQTTVGETWCQRRLGEAPGASEPILYSYLAGESLLSYCNLDINISVTLVLQS